MMERPRFLKSSADARSHTGRPFRQLTWGVICLLALFIGLQVWWLVTATPTVAAGPRIIEIPAHLGVLDIARRLDKADIIRSPFGFALLALVQGKARSLKAGEDEIPQGANTFAVLSLLEGGKVLYHPVLLKEGGTLNELARTIEAEGLAGAAGIIRVGRVPRHVGGGLSLPRHVSVRQGRHSRGDALAHGDEDARSAHAGDPRRSPRARLQRASAAHAGLHHRA